LFDLWSCSASVSFCMRTTCWSSALSLHDALPIWVVEVALENLGAASDDFAFFAIRHYLIRIFWIHNADFSVRERNADVAGAAAIGHRIANKDGGGFRKAKAFHQAALGELFPIFHGRYWKGCRAGESAANALNRNALVFSCFHDSAVESGHAGNPGGGALFHDVHDQRNLWCWQKN